jgi:SAM-dependent methyltransferase
MNEASIKATASSIPRSKNCPCCDSEKVMMGTVTLAAFVAERMTNTVQLDDWMTEAQQCEACGFINTHMRFTDEQMQRYYHEYMMVKTPDGDARQCGSYIFHRRRVDGEDWLSLIEFYNSPGWFAARKHSVIGSLNLLPDFDVNTIKTVVDYGGDLGQYIPNELDHAPRYVVEVEPRDLLVGIKQISSPNEAEAADLLICCHTLEHVSWPRDLLTDMKRYVKPGGLIYLEVPNEDNYVINNNGKLKFHEHINIFFQDSLQHLAVSMGLEVLKTINIPYNTMNAAFEPARAIIARMP